MLPINHGAGFALAQQFPTGVPREFLKHVMPDYLVMALTSFPLDCQRKR